MDTLVTWHYPAWRPGQAHIAAAGGADRRSAKNADAPMDQSREAHRSARPHHSPRGDMTSTDDSTIEARGTHSVCVGSMEVSMCAAPATSGIAAHGFGD